MWAILFICLVPFLAYIHTISYDFVYDDDFQILRNPWIHDWSKVGQFFTTDVWSFARTEVSTSYYRPFHMVAHAVGYSLSELRPEGYHLISIVLHVINTLLVSLIALRLTKEKSIAILGGLFFALHPVHAESVAWIAGVTDPLCAVFYFGALYLYLGDIKGRPKPWKIAGYLLLFLCGMLSKEMAASFLLVAPLIDWCLLRKLRWNRYALILGAFVVYGILRITALGQFMPESQSLSMSYFELALNMIIVPATYIVKLFVPYNVGAFHVFYPPESIMDARFLGSIAALLIFALLAWWQRKHRATILLFGFAVVSILPLMNLSGIAAKYPFAERYLYIPSLASCLLIPLLVQSAWQHRPAAIPPLGKQASYIILCPLLLVYGAVMIRTSFMWKDAHTLYTESIKREPDSPAPINLLAQYYFKNNDYEKAAPLFHRVIELSNSEEEQDKKRLLAAYIGLGGIRFNQKLPNEAKEYFEKAYNLSPETPAVLTNLGSVHMALGDYDAATRFLEASLAANPRNEIIYNNLAVMYLKLGQYEQAISRSQQAVEIFPKFGKAYISMAEAYAAQGLNDKAREAYKKAIEVDPIQKPFAEKALKALEESLTTE